MLQFALPACTHRRHRRLAHTTVAETTGEDRALFSYLLWSATGAYTGPEAIRAAQGYWLNRAEQSDNGILSGQQNSMQVYAS